MNEMSAALDHSTESGHDHAHAVTWLKISRVLFVAASAVSCVARQKRIKPVHNYSRRDLYIGRWFSNLS